MGALAALMEVAAQRPADLFTVVERARDDLPPGLGEEARALSARAAEGGDYLQAERAAMVASVIFVVRGARRDALDNHLNTLQIRFVLAESPEEYLRLRDDARACKAMAEDLGAPNVAFAAAVVAADCAYFHHYALAEGPYPPDMVNESFLVALDDVVVAAQLVDDALGEGWLVRFLSLAAATAERAGDERGNSVAVRGQLRVLARNLRPSMVDGLPFPGGEQQAAPIRALLRRLAYL